VVLAEEEKKKLKEKYRESRNKPTYKQNNDDGLFNKWD